MPAKKKGYHEHSHSNNERLAGSCHNVRPMRGCFVHLVPAFSRDIETPPKGEIDRKLVSFV